MWGQLSILRKIRRSGTAGEIVNVRKDGSLEGVHGVGDVVHALRLVVSRHDALRTRHRIEDGGEPTQTVVADGELLVPVYASSAVALPQTMAQVARDLVFSPFTPDELPIRAGIVTVDGAPARVVLSLHRLSADGLASTVVYEEILRLGLDPSAGFPDAWQPHQIVEKERGADSQRLGD